MTRYFATCAGGLEALTAAELTRLGAEQVEPGRGGAAFETDLRGMYRILRSLRTVNRVLLPLRDFSANTPEMLYSQARRVRWEDYLNPQRTFAVYATIEGPVQPPPAPAARPFRDRGRGPPRGPRDRPGPPSRGAPRGGITHTQYAALKIKDAIADRLRREQGARPDVDTDRPDFRVQAHFANGRCTLYLDACGASLHERGYRLMTTEAPLRETLAAAVAEIVDWDGQRPWLDPMCGSGTLAIEAALRARRIAPGLLRPEFACQRWPNYQAALWAEVEQELKSQALPALAAPVIAADVDPRAIAAARTNAQRAGVEGDIEFVVRDLRETPRLAERGTAVMNPPYGARLGAEVDLHELYRALTEVCRTRLAGWDLFVLAGNLTLARDIDFTAERKFKLFNGGLDCRLLHFVIPGPHESLVP